MSHSTCLRGSSCWNGSQHSEAKVSSCCAWTFIGSSWSSLQRWIGFRVRQGWVTISFDAWLAWEADGHAKTSSLDKGNSAKLRGFICAAAMDIFVFFLACSKLRAFNLCICVCVWLLSFILSQIPSLNSLQKYQLYRQVHLHQMLRQQQREQVQLGSPALMTQSSAFFTWLNLWSQVESLPLKFQLTYVAAVFPPRANFQTYWRLSWKYVYCNISCRFFVGIRWQLTCIQPCIS